jgi:hypothetical protein
MQKRDKRDPLRDLAEPCHADELGEPVVGERPARRRDRLHEVDDRIGVLVERNPRASRFGRGRRPLAHLAGQIGDYVGVHVVNRLEVNEASSVDADVPHLIVHLVKGKPFNPDERMRGILEKAAKIANAQMRVQSFADRRPDRVMWKDREWEWASLRPENGTFDTPNYKDLEAREKWFYQAQIESPAMFRRTAAAGSLYWLGTRDGTIRLGAV